jgi:hypothetical protein
LFVAAAQSIRNGIYFFLFDLYPPDPAAFSIANHEQDISAWMPRGRCTSAGLTFFAKIQTVQSARNLAKQPIVCWPLLRSSNIQTNVVRDYNSICAERF